MVANCAADRTGRRETRCRRLGLAAEPPCTAPIAADRVGPNRPDPRDYLGHYSAVQVAAKRRRGFGRWRRFLIFFLGRRCLETRNVVGRCR